MIGNQTKCPSGFAWCARGALLCGACQPFSIGMEEKPMKCHVCGKDAHQAGALYRQNEKGIEGVWACDQHRKKLFTLT